MKKQFNYLLLATLGALTLSSCAREDAQNVDQDSLYAIYNLDYNESEYKTTARSTFRLGGPTGTRINFNERDEVYFNGDPLSYESFSGSYRRHYAGLVSHGTFEYTDLNDNTFVNNVPSIERVSFIGINQLSASLTTPFVWIGPPVRENEIVTLTIDGTESGNTEVFATTLVGVNFVVLPASQLQRLGLGAASAKITRKRTKNWLDQGTTRGGRMSTSYTDETTLQIME